MIKIASLCILLAAVFACPDEANCRACIEVNKEFRCELCYMGWVDKSGNCVIRVKDKIDNCERYVLPAEKEPVKCDTCDFGYYVDNGKCIPCKVEGCAICSQGNGCEACLNGNKLHFLDPKCLKEASAVPNCEVCNYFSVKADCKCVICKKDYTIDINQPDEKACVADKVGHCQYLNKDDTNKCSICLVGYYITKDGKCSNSGSKAAWWIIPVVIVAIILASLLIWYCIKKRREANHGHDHYHTVPVPVNANTNLPYTQRLVN